MEKIVINADDFGLTESCTKAICEAFERKLITHTTMIANGKAYEFALSCIEEYQLQDKVGIHFNLTDGVPLTEPIKECKAFVTNGVFHGKINRLKPLSKVEKQAVYEELEAQMKRLKKDGLKILRADSHNHIHTSIFIAPLVIDVCKKYEVLNIRIHRNIGEIPKYKKIVKNLYNIWLRKQGFQTTQYFGLIEDIKQESIKGKRIEQLEIMVHPDYSVKNELIDTIMVGNKVIEENMETVAHKVYDWLMINGVI